MFVLIVSIVSLVLACWIIVTQSNSFRLDISAVFILVPSIPQSGEVEFVALGFRISLVCRLGSNPH